MRIQKRIQKSKDSAVEFKRAKGGVPADFWTSYSSFSNTDGGVIILGVHEKDGKRDIEGLADTDKIVSDFWNVVNNPDKVSANVLFNESIYTEQVIGKPAEVIGKPAEVIGKPAEVKEKTSEVKEKTLEVVEKTAELGEKKSLSDVENALSVHVKPVSVHVRSVRTLKGRSLLIQLQ